MLVIHKPFLQGTLVCLKEPDGRTETRAKLSLKCSLSNESVSCLLRGQFETWEPPRLTPCIALFQVRPAGPAPATEHGVGFDLIFYLRYSNWCQSPRKFLQMCFCKRLMAPSFLCLVLAIGRVMGISI